MLTYIHIHVYIYSRGVVCVSVYVAGEDTKHTDGRRDNIEGGQSLSIWCQRGDSWHNKRRDCLASLFLRVSSLCASLPRYAQYSVGCWNVLNRVFWCYKNLAWLLVEYYLFICIYTIHIDISYKYSYTTYIKISIVNVYLHIPFSRSGWASRPFGRIPQSWHYRKSQYRAP